jgi:hypothetical protein
MWALDASDGDASVPSVTVGAEGPDATDAIVADATAPDLAPPLQATPSAAPATIDALIHRSAIGTAAIVQRAPGEKAVPRGLETRVVYVLGEAGPRVVAIMAKQDDADQRRMIERLRSWASDRV